MSPEAPSRRALIKRILQAAVSLAIVVGIFVGVLPRFASYGDVWDTIRDMTGLELSTLGVIGAWNIVTYWFVMVAVLPGLRFREAAVVICTSFETMGLLVYRRIAPFDLVMDLAGGMSRSMYRKLENWILDRRENQDQPSWAEWFEWLAKLADQYKDEQTLSRGEVVHWRPR